ncbi:hypothetical protein ACIQXQ_20055 [Peribacillus sp. NPDC097198]|uniref:hypothetical protein n=1 Tax=Peribacillus sp. NPDC097198 TaxID=3364397 RepID=UPI0037FA4342
MERKEIFLLREEKNRKEITNKAIAEHLLISESHISKWFRLKGNMSREKEIAAAEFIRSHDEFEYKVVKVKVKD